MSIEAARAQTALAFGPRGRQLFGVLHAAAAGTPVRAGVVLCNAFGQEAIRAHRLMRVVAERLARNGHPVLRFDYYGTGDSMGDDLDGDLDGWAGDVLAADAELRARTGCSRTAWLGLRLGGAVALRAARRGAPAGLERLVLFDAVFDGLSYLDRLRDRHVASLEAAFSLMPHPTPRERARDPAAFTDEAIGFRLSPVLREQIGALRPSAPAWPERPAAIVALVDPATPEGVALATALTADPARVQRIDMRHGTDWTRDTADNTPLVPAQALLALVQQLGEAA